MQTHPRTEKLRQLMQAHNLEPDDVADLVDRSRQSVRMWCCNHERAIPAPLLQLLEFKLAARGANVH